MTFDLPDAVSHYHAKLQFNNYQWTFLCVTAGAMLTVLWTQEAAQVPKLKWVLLVAWIVFAAGNLMMIVDSQRELLRTKVAIANALTSDVAGTVSPEFRELLLQLPAYPVWKPSLAHLLIDSLVVIALAVR